MQWLRDGLGIIERAAETEALAQSLDSNDGVYFVPALTGLGSPHWDPYARGTIVGLTRGVGRAHIARATLEAIAYQTVDAVRAMEARQRHAADRAAGRRRRDRQRLAHAVPGRRARRARWSCPRSRETTALGAAMLAGVGAGVWSQDRGRAQLARALRATSRRWATTSARRCWRDWRRAVARAREWVTAG